MDRDRTIWQPTAGSKAAHLVDELRDVTCTGWTCLECGRSEYKAFGLECEACGFDASPFVPLDRRGKPIVRVPVGYDANA
ncbi:hypothetical protein [Microcystis phage Mwe-JY26]